MMRENMLHDFDKNLRIDIAVPRQLQHAWIAAALILAQYQQRRRLHGIKGDAAQGHECAKSLLSPTAFGHKDAQQPFLSGKHGQQQFLAAFLCLQNNAVIAASRFLIVNVTRPPAHRFLLLRPAPAFQRQESARLSDGQSGTAVLPIR